MTTMQRYGTDLKCSWARPAGRWVLGLAVLAVAGCKLLPEAQPDPTRFYVLSSRAAATGAAESGADVQLRPVELAGYLRNPPMVVRRGEHEIEFRDQARWGEPLETGIGRLLREELGARGVRVAGGAGREATEGARQVVVRVLACEGTAAGGVEFRTGWEVIAGGEKPARLAGGEHRATGLRWDGKNEATLAAQLSEAVAGLAAEIAGALGRQ